MNSCIMYGLKSSVDNHTTNSAVEKSYAPMKDVLELDYRQSVPYSVL